MNKDKFWRCTECDYEWEGKGTEWCPFCGTADFAEEVKIFVCMGCGYEWEYKTHSCPKCGSGDFAEEDYEENI